ncbi:hypothetical protein M2G45_21125, partial [Vibrio vulnificus]|nr:hypothetical protein [Vibrio vulnificus]
CGQPHLGWPHGSNTKSNPKSQSALLFVTRNCPETCLNGADQSVDAQDNQYDTLLLSCSVTQTL